MNLEKEDLLQKEGPDITEESIKIDIKHLAEGVDGMGLEDIKKKLEKLITGIFDLKEGKENICEECGIGMAGDVFQCPQCGTETGFSKPANKGIA